MNELWFHHQRSQIDGTFCEWYRCFSGDESVQFEARATRLGKPVPIFRGDRQTGEIRNRKGYVLNGRTDIHAMEPEQLIGSYARLGQVRDAADTKIARWKDGRKWSEEFKESLVDALANAVLGSGDVPTGANPGDIQVFSNGKQILATLSREKLAFFPDPPKSTEPGKFAKLASRIVPGELGKSLGEVTPPRGWKLTILEPTKASQLLTWSALVHLEYMRWSRQ